jgi:hypothetical protein
VLDPLVLEALDFGLLPGECFGFGFFFDLGFDFGFGFARAGLAEDLAGSRVAVVRAPDGRGEVAEFGFDEPHPAVITPASTIATTRRTTAPVKLLPGGC